MPEQHKNDPGAVENDPAASDLPGDSSRDGAKKRRDPNRPAAIIGIGASAGGIAALQEFFADMSTESGLAFVVVMHLSPEFESQLPNVLQQKTKMPVVQVNEPVKVRPNQVYVIPPNKQLTLNDSMLDVVEPQQQIGKRIAIDLFFRTLAQAYGQRAVCVIMSGADSDGVIGLKHIRAQGGLTIAQDPNEAEFDSMPASAISTGMVDWVLPVAEMPGKLLEFVRNENRMRLPPEIPESDEPDAKVADAPGGSTVSPETRATEDEEAIGKILADVRVQTGHDFSHYKRATVLRRIARRLQVNSLETLPQYLEFIRTHPAEGRALLQDLLIGVTHFFRDRESFVSLQANIPQLFAGKKPDDEVRVWIAGCATGEEAYSIAMLLCEYCKRLDNPPKVQIFATDVDEQAIADARDGLYPSTIEADVSPELLREFFARDHGRYRMRKEVREKVLFAAHNLLRDAPFSRCDLISCRNLLIYLNAHAQQGIFETFHFALRPGGLLFLGDAESQTEAQTFFAPLDPKHRIFVRRSMPRPIWKVPSIPLRPITTGGRAAMPLRNRPLPPLTHDSAEKASTGGSAATFAAQTRRDVLFGELHLRLLEEYGPPSVVVNEVHEVVHLSPNAGRYLQFAAGEPTANITKVVAPGLGIEMRTALFKAAQEKTTVRGAPTAVEVEGKTEVITLEVRPMRANDQAEGFFLVLFERERDAAQSTVSPTTHDAIVRGADEEIQILKEQLANTIEQYEATNEELKASNEELQAMNEEMRSATEELETSKEELQSVNEELSTVNYELKTNVEELSYTNADLNNLMASTDIGTIFLDRQLRIHRFTPSAQKIFNLIPADIGRPISDITSRLHYDGFLQDLERVMQDLHTIEREVHVGEGETQWYLTRIAPYRTADDRIAGVVATFINITPRKNAEDELRKSETRMRRAMQIKTIGIFYFTSEGQITEANDAFLELTGYTQDDVENGRVRWDKMTPPEFMAVTRKEMKRFGATGKIGPYEKQYIRKDGERWWGLFTGTRLRENLGVEYVLDVSDRKKAGEALHASEERFRNLADNVPALIWTNDAAGAVNYFNKRWYDYTGLTPEESMGPEGQQIIHPEDAPATTQQWQRALAEGKIFSAEYRLRGRDGNYRWFIGRNVPLRDDGKIVSWFGSATDIDDFKKASTALRESEERYRLLVDGARDHAIFLLSPSNDIVYWSAGAERVFGWSAEEAIGQSGELVFTPEDRAIEQEEKEIETALQDGCASDRRWHLRKDGSRIWVDGVMHRLDDEQTGALRGFAKIARDATKERLAEEELKKAHSELEDRVKERTTALVATNSELHKEMRRRQMLEREILKITERERARIGQDLHDGLCQELTATAFLLKSKAKTMAREVPECAKALQEAAETVNENAGRARDLARGLHPFELGSGGLLVALRELVTRANERTPCRGEFPRSLRVSDEGVALNLYRVAQEAVNNALKHARASEVIIGLREENDELVLTVKDDGTGIRSLRKNKRMGIHMMKYRADVSGGKLEIESRRGRGTTVTCRVPLNREK
jgi:two-component system, chemotaxis family, CheB/CheR fusion protein